MNTSLKSLMNCIEYTGGGRLGGKLAQPAARRVLRGAVPAEPRGGGRAVRGHAAPRARLQPALAQPAASGAALTLTLTLTLLNHEVAAALCVDTLHRAHVFSQLSPNQLRLVRL
jgi:hypothetical protein